MLSPEGHIRLAAPAGAPPGSVLGPAIFSIFVDAPATALCVRSDAESGGAGSSCSEMCQVKVLGSRQPRGEQPGKKKRPNFSCLWTGWGPLVWSWLGNGFHAPQKRCGCRQPAQPRWNQWDETYPQLQPNNENAMCIEPVLGMLWVHWFGRTGTQL